MLSMNKQIIDLQSLSSSPPKTKLSTYFTSFITCSCLPDLPKRAKQSSGEWQAISMVSRVEQVVVLLTHSVRLLHKEIKTKTRANKMALFPLRLS